MKAISIKQPWAHYIVTGQKPLENRSWYTSFRGPILIHASKKFDSEGYDWIGVNADRLGVELPLMHPEQFYCGGIIGIAILKDCWDRYESPWFVGPWGWYFSSVLEFEKPIEWKGQLGIFEIPSMVEWVEQVINGGEVWENI